MNRPSSVLTFFCIALIFVAFAAQAGDVGSDRIVLNAEASSSPPGVNLKSASDEQCTVIFDLPYLDRETVTVNGRSYQALSIPGGGLAGKVGHPGIPTYSGLLALPIGRSVRATILTRKDQTLQDTQLLPIQPDKADEFVIDAAQYATPGQPSPTVILGEPAIMHGRRVVPFVIRPVVFDPTAGTATVSTHLEIGFTFEGQDNRNNPRSAPTDLPASFAGLYADRVVNAVPATADKSVGTDGLGIYMVVCPDEVGVVTALQPLLEWRRRQGYQVQLTTFPPTGTSAAAVKSLIQETYDTATTPLEFVVLVGDHGGSISVPTWFESVSGYGGGGDHYYSELEGDDVLPDVFIGRLSCRNTTELAVIVNKIVTYETEPPTNDPGWFTRASLTADPSASGITTIFVSQWLKAQLEATGFAQVDTIWSGNYASQMYASLNQGLSVFTYRGYVGMSGFNNGHITNASNRGKLPFAIFPTCDSGSWASETMARNEAFLRSENGGAIGAIGLATLGTHTRYNNALFNGIGEAAINGSDHRLGVAQAGGKLEVFAQYQAAEPHIVEIWSVWSSLIGDPATDLWLSYPTTLTVEHPAALPVGAGAVPVTVTSEGLPVADAVVAVYKNGEVSVSGTTDEAGRVTLVLPSHSAGSLLVTVWGHGLMPYRGSLTVGDVDLFINLQQTDVDDDAGPAGTGNGDGIVNPAETLHLSCWLQNMGTELAGAVSAVLTSNDPHLTILDASDTFGDMAAGARAWGDGGFMIEVAPTAPAGHELALTLTARSGATDWVSAIRLPVSASALAQTSFVWSPGGGLEPGESGTLSLTLVNEGILAAQGAAGVLTSSSPWILVTDDFGNFGSIPIGQFADNSINPFALDIAPDCFQGHLATFNLEVTESNGTVQVVEFSLPVGSVSSSDPVGPDAYGYYAIDDSDTGYELAPTFDWVEIDPRYGGTGTSVGLSDFGYEQDDTKTLDLPFTFTYYGQDFDQIAVCSNGWIAMGNTTLRNWRNWGIPGAGNPDAMIAPFWDDLKQAGENLVYSWYDEANQRFIIQWSRLTNSRGAIQNFEVILHDPLLYPTATGDGEILFQYAAVNNNDSNRGYATVGIQNLDGTDGLLYTYYNRYAPGAPPLANFRAILLRPDGATANATCDVEPQSITVRVGPDQQTVENLRIGNNGEVGSVLRYQIEKVDPNMPTAPPAGDKDVTGSTFTASVSEYLPGETIDVVFTANCVSGDEEWITSLEADFPPGVIVNSASAMSAPVTFTYDGDLGDGALASWIDGRLTDGQSGISAMNLTFASSFGPVEIPFTLFGDTYGSPPHSVSGTITLEQGGPQVRVLAPDGGELWNEGEAREIQFHASGGPETVLIELDRGDGQGWQTLAEDVPGTSGTYPWTVTLPPSVHCRIRISDTADPALQDVSDGEFTIGRDLTWVTVGDFSGIVAAGAGEDIDLAFDSTGMADGTYLASLVVTNTAGDPVHVPITLIVGGASATGDAPTLLGLTKNYPNPFNPWTTIGFALPAAGPVRLQVFDMRGRLVKTLHEGNLPAGHHSLMWDGTDSSGHPVNSGVFVYRMVSGEQVISRKMLLMK